LFSAVCFLMCDCIANQFLLLARAMCLSACILQYAKKGSAISLNHKMKF
jgi:hypothetical protein